ncbi:hypothetical protein J2W27_004442 [Variovorax boronicumulans]|uniref:STM3941 family protein n=1 Tax=Variovorax boronicumulans TaxID=436515 RepID=UPI002785E5C3|nr:STM3941 family protein [Variovorax boronicumulans]MDP9912316.1 hypothetical protein [Variovorax boronicumulans]
MSALVLLLRFKVNLLASVAEYVTQVYLPLSADPRGVAAHRENSGWANGAVCILFFLSRDSPPSRMTSVVVYPSRLRMALMLLGALAFVAGGVWLLMHPFRETRVAGWVVAWASILFFGAAGLFALTRLFSRKPALTIDHTGIVDNASGLAAGFIPWSDVVDAQVFEFQRQRFLGLSLRNPQDYLAQASPLKRLLMKANASLVGFPVNIPEATLSMTVATLLTHINEFRHGNGEAL